MKEHSIVHGMLNALANRPNGRSIDALTDKVLPDAAERKKKFDDLRKQVKNKLGDDRLLSDFIDAFCLSYEDRVDVTYLSGVSDGLELADLFKTLKGA